MMENQIVRFASQQYEINEMKLVSDVVDRIKGIPDLSYDRMQDILEQLADTLPENVFSQIQKKLPVYPEDFGVMMANEIHKEVRR
jgi:hypothetical protein